MAHSATLELRRFTERRWAYVLFRVAIGIDFFGHGFIRVYHGTGVFAAWMVGTMAGTPLLPVWFVHGFGYFVPWLEVTVGLMMLLALRTRVALTGAMLLMLCLMAGTALKQDWGAESLQLGYTFYLAVLLFLRPEYDADWPTLLGSGAEP